mmetsp:Transcript_40364/g.116598  ORF Transcript_40364/g.116598 Transcript_40364/m.116598 type:complete len:219 (-) Transcript_40364:589-1245(-)
MTWQWELRGCCHVDASQRSAPQQPLAAAPRPSPLLPIHPPSPRRAAAPAPADPPAAEPAGVGPHRHPAPLPLLLQQPTPLHLPLRRRRRPPFPRLEPAHPAHRQRPLLQDPLPSPPLPSHPLLLLPGPQLRYHLARSSFPLSPLLRGTAAADPPAVIQCHRQSLLQQALHLPPPPPAPPASPASPAAPRRPPPRPSPLQPCHRRPHRRPRSRPRRQRP